MGLKLKQYITKDWPEKKNEDKNKRTICVPSTIDVVVIFVGFVITIIAIMSKRREMERRRIKENHENESKNVDNEFHR